MDLTTKLRYQGCVSTPPLWKNSTVFLFEQIELSSDSEAADDSIVFKNQRLGKLVEEFVFYQLKSRHTISWIFDSLQIQQGKRTVGEIDALYYEGEVPVHLEVAYKFYLFDTIEDYDEPLAYWIGPNRKDSLFYKLGKLEKRQFPLLYNEVTQTYLKHYDLDVKAINQRLCFKAQLFLPYQSINIDVSPLNADCIAGFYISFHKMSLFRECEFFVPVKLDWLIMPSPNVEWMDYSSALEAIVLDIIEKRSPLVWIKRNDNEISKCFVVFW